MKTHFILLFLLFQVSISFGQSAHLGEEKKLQAKANKIEKYYQLSTTQQSNLKYQMLFFNEFPANFLELKQLYGSSGIIRDHAENHILKLFDKLSGIKESTYYAKLIQIAIGGSFEADGINYFKFVLRNHCHANPTLTFNLLRAKTDMEIFEFWYFYFDGPHPDEQVPEEFHPMKTTHSRTYDLMERALLKAKKMNE